MPSVKVTVLIIGLALQAGIALAEGSGAIQGRILDNRSGEPLPGVSVVVVGTTLGDATDALGTYRIVGVPAGRRRIEAAIIGYRSAQVEVDVVPTEPVLADFHLEQTPVQVGSVVVTGTRSPRYIKDVPVRTEVLTGEALENKAAHSLYEALDDAPGIRIEQQCQSCNFSMVRMQGLGADHTQVLIDGQPLYSGLASIYGLQQLGTADVDRIEIVKGAGSALYGSGAIAGGINIISKCPAERPETKVGMELGSHSTNTFDLFSSQRTGAVGIAVSAQKNTGNVIDETGDGSSRREVRSADGISDRVKTDATTAGVRLTVDGLRDTDQLWLSGRMMHELRLGGVLTDDLFTNPFGPGTERITTDRYETQAGYRCRLGPGRELEVSAAYAHHDRDATNDGFLNDYMAAHQDTMPSLEEMRPYLACEHMFVGNVSLGQALPSGHRLLVGAQYSHDRLEESGKYVVVDTEDPLYGESYTSTSRKRADQVGVYVQDDCEISRALELVGGVRYDYHNSRDAFRGSGGVAPHGVEPVRYDASTLNPRLAVRFTPRRSVTLRSSVGTGFRVPYGFSEDLHLCSGSPRVWKGADLKPERSISYSISADYDCDRLSVAVNLFHTELRNAIAFVAAKEGPAQLGYTYEWKNVGNASVQGLELTTRLALRDNLIVSIDAALNHGRYDHPRTDWVGTDYQDDSRCIPRFPQTTGGIKLDFTPVGWEFGIETEYQGRMYIDYISEEPTQSRIKHTDPFAIVNARVSRTLFQRLMSCVRQIRPKKLMV
ncbi:MAG: TonB-dependent receptor [Candidatus Zixiibacteriota bacterium]